ncbi:MAG: outer membrane protein assembly factor BamA [Rickettsiales bacterium]|jgi:outer membrane protein insertion porin family|nr:outer membrane protein assembly factor BamA [Rickettsiales bacterium]
MKISSIASLLILVFAIFCGIAGAVKSAKAFVIKDIVVEGVVKFDPALIKSAIDIKIGDNVQKSDIDTAVKKLYSMNIFSNIEVQNNDGILLFKASENPVINEIFFEGNDELTTENILKELTIKPKSMFSKSVVKINADKLVDMYRSIGFLSAVVNPKTITRDNGQVDIVFEVVEGKKAYIKEILFVGNKNFSKTELLKEVRSKEYAWWKLMAQFDIYDENMIKYDTELLKKFYTANGFLDASIGAPSVKASIDKSNFYVVFNLTEGSEYKIGEVKITSDIPEVNVDDLYKELVIKNGYKYSGSLISLSIKKITDKLGEYGYAFIQVNPDMKPNKETSFVDITFQIKESRKAYINNINIIGNTRTLDTVIRREMEIKEQDAYNILSLQNSEQRLNRIGYFKSVKLLLSPEIGTTDKVNVNVQVEENSTGEMSASLGWSSLNGLILELGVRENNFRGKGQKVGITASWSDLQKRVMFNFTEPYFLDRDLSAGFDIAYTRYDYYEHYGYNVDSFRLGGQLGWSWTKKIYQSVGMALQADSYSQIHPELRGAIESGFVPTSKIYQSIAFADAKPDYINNSILEYSARLHNELSAGLSDDPYFKTGVELKSSYTLTDYNITFGVMANAGHIDPFDESLPRTYRYFLGGENLRGFATAGAGSRLSMAYTAGGNSMFHGNAQIGFPIGFAKEYNISGFLFYDVGWVSAPDDKNVIDMRNIKGTPLLWDDDNDPDTEKVPLLDGDNNPLYGYGTLGSFPVANKDFLLERYANGVIDESFRTSVGFGIFWHSPMGPIKLTWGYPLKYKDYDELERFRFSISTLF